AMKSEWFMKLMGDELGPYTLDELGELAQKGTVSADTLIRKGVGGPWCLATDIPDLFRVRERRIETSLTQHKAPMARQREMAPASSRDRAVAGREFEEVLFHQSGVLVTPSRFVVSAQTYALSAITSVRYGQYTISRDRSSQLLLVIFGVVIAAVAAISLVGIIASSGALLAACVALLFTVAGITLSVFGMKLMTKVEDRQVHFVANGRNRSSATLPGAILTR
ncbi:MAG: DUF6232 family protein, partial [Candidatus Acidiferrales bacterium]